MILASQANFWTLYYHRGKRQLRDLREKGENSMKLIANETPYQLSYTPEIFEEAPFKVQNGLNFNWGPTRFAP